MENAKTMKLFTLKNSLPYSNCAWVSIGKIAFVVACLLQRL